MALRNAVVLEIVRCVYQTDDGIDSVKTYQIQKLVKDNMQRDRSSVSRAVQILERQSVLLDRSSDKKAVHLLNRKRLEELFVYIKLPNTVYVYDNNLME